ncbi:MAG TPA: hypothetical protein VMD75_11285 [Candidatus Binataceae bacterium]|nr:hypothetical protein [Candidatus Binataceae bacterium]
MPQITPKKKMQPLYRSPYWLLNPSHLFRFPRVFNSREFSAETFFRKTPGD